MDNCLSDGDLAKSRRDTLQWTASDNRLPRTDRTLLNWTRSNRMAIRLLAVLQVVGNIWKPSFGGSVLISRRTHCCRSSGGSPSVASELLWVCPGDIAAWAILHEVQQPQETKLQDLRPKD